MSGLLVASGRGNPVTVFSSFGPDNRYDSANGELVDNVSSSFHAFAAAFIPDQSGALEGANLGMSIASRGSASVSLFADKSNSPDSANAFLLGSMTPTKPLEPDNNSVLSFTYGGSPLMLHAGTLYWIGVQAPLINTSIWWNFATPGLTGTVATSTDFTNWSVTPGQRQFAFDVLANIPVPEPEPTWLVIIGMICLCCIATWRTYCRNSLERALSRSGRTKGALLSNSVNVKPWGGRVTGIQ
jgi:hypothetical protein